MMAQKKNEEVLTADDKMIPAAEESKVGGSIVDTFWDQYEVSRERALKLRENREDAFLNTVKEVIKFNRQYRKSIAKLYDQTKKTNKEVVTELMHQFTSDKEEIKEEVKVEEVHTGEREELKKQLKEVTGQLEKLALTPIKSVFQIIEQVEDNFEKSTESNIAFARERRNAWFQVRKGYVDLARNTTNSFVDRSKNGLKELVKAR
jgi:Na+/phosphate symporter